VKNWRAVTLADVCNFENGDRGKNYPGKSAILDEGVPFVNAGDLNDGSLRDGSLSYISADQFRKLSNGKFKKGDILFCLRGTLGKFASVESDISGAIASSLIIIRPKNSICPKYLKSYLGSRLCEEQIDLYRNGAAQPNLAASSLKKFKIPLPPLDEQRRIAAILDKADTLRRKRKRALDLLDNLAQSIFLELFGDPIANPKGWKERPLADFEVFLTSGSRGWAKHYSHSGRAFIRIQNLQKGELSTGDIQYVDAPDSAEARRTTVRSGDVLISITADLGRTAVVPDALDNQAHINQHIALVRTKGINPVYLSMYLASRAGQAQFDALNRQGVKAGLNFENIRSLRILVPPTALQERYVDMRKRIKDTAIILGREALLSQSLFSSLQSRAFSGQL
jgi:type I restriction enzyme S subunit